MIHSRQSYGSYLIYSLCLFVGVAGPILGLNSLIAKGDREALFAIIAGPLLIWWGLGAITAQYEIDIQSIRMRTIWKSRTILWSDVVELRAKPNYFGQFVIVIATKSDDRGVALISSFMENQKEIVRAIAEASFLSNPDVRVGRIFASIYGLPPYGIFADSKVSVNHD